MAVCLPTPAPTPSAMLTAPFSVRLTSLVESASTVMLPAAEVTRVPEPRTAASTVLSIVLVTSMITTRP